MGERPHRVKLSRRDIETIRRALNYAIGDRESFSDAYSNKGPEAKEALADIVRFEKLHIKLLGRPSARACFAAMLDAGASIAIHDITPTNERNM